MSAVLQAPRRAILMLAVLPSLALAQHSPANGAEVLGRMRQKYATSWYPTLTFSQKTTMNRNGTTSVQTWYETLQYFPGGAKLRIDFDKPAAGNGILYSADSDWVVRSDTLAAVRGDGSVRPAPVRDPELYYQASTVPGAHLPHAWVGDATRKLSTLDLAGYDALTLITGIAGEPWAAAAAKVGNDLGVPLRTVIIGPGRAVTDIYYDWARLREVNEDGVLLVRPDKFIGWRSMSLPADPERALRDALGALLSTGGGE